MSNNNAKCECGNEWELRKPVEEVERLRCSECGKTGDSIQMVAGVVDEGGSGKLSVFERIELEERHTDLRKRAEAVAERIRRLGGPKVPEELEPAHRRLSAVSEELSERGDLSESELDEIENFIEEKEIELDDLDVADEITGLEQRKRELKAEIGELEKRKRELLNTIGMVRSKTR